MQQNNPNPFGEAIPSGNPTTNISFIISEKGHVKLNIFNLQGKLVSTLVDDVLETGTYNYQWITNDTNKQLASGVYFYSISVNGFTDTKKMILLR
ncbi:MAG: T9SS type A sorting domain-containing protein [Melioribacteraceae bacterium]|nr:T9SS type A sorting domain-containing protein [Melioribacteraceae bacterium]